MVACLPKDAVNCALYFERNASGESALFCLNSYDFAIPVGIKDCELEDLRATGLLTMHNLHARCWRQSIALSLIVAANPIIRQPAAQQRQRLPSPVVDLGDRFMNFGFISMDQCAPPNLLWCWRRY